jgi:hypothetical protein
MKTVRDDIRARYPSLAAEAEHSRTAAIHLYCLECNGGSTKLVGACTAHECFLWPYSPAASRIKIQFAHEKKLRVQLPQSTIEASPVPDSQPDPIADCSASQSVIRDPAFLPEKGVTMPEKFERRCTVCRGRGVHQNAPDQSRKCERCQGTGFTGPWLDQRRPPKAPPREVVSLPLPGSETWGR